MVGYYRNHFKFQTIIIIHYKHSIAEPEKYNQHGNGILFHFFLKHFFFALLFTDPCKMYTNPWMSVVSYISSLLDTFNAFSKPFISLEKNVKWTGYCEVWKKYAKQHNVIFRFMINHIILIWNDGNGGAVVRWWR